MSANHVKLGAVHAAPVFMDAAATAAKAVAYVERARDESVSLLVFPEVFIPGFPYWINSYPPLVQAGLNREYQDQSIERDGPEMMLIRDAARRCGVAVVIGASERRQGGRTCYNSGFIIDRDGRLLGVHRKLQPTYAERYIWGQGDGSSLLAWDTAVGRVSTLACWEHTMNLARQALIEQGAEIHAALWPSLSTIPGFEGVAQLQIEAMMRNHALTGQCFVVSASSPVSVEMVDYLEQRLGAPTLLTAGGGWTAIIHPFAATLAGPVTGEAETLVAAEINRDDIKDVKMWVDSTGHYARPDVLRLVFDRTQKLSCVIRDTAKEDAAGDCSANASSAAE